MQSSLSRSMRNTPRAHARRQGSASLRSLFLVVFSLGIGLTLGFGSTWREFRGVRNEMWPEDHDPANIDLEARRGAPTHGARVLVVGGPSYDFGTLPRYAKGTHAFIIRNEGEQVLTLEPMQPSCKCTHFSIAGVEHGKGKVRVKPQEQVEAVVDVWANTPDGDKEFYQEAPIKTNDPLHQQLTLKVSALVETTVKAVPGQLVISGFPSGSGVTAETRVFAFNEDQLEITGVEFEKQDLLDKFDVELTPVTAEELANQYGARAGVRATFHVKPGMPLGTFEQVAKLQTNLTDSPTVELKISGEVTGDISLLGPRFTTGQNVLNFGMVARGRGAKTDLQILVKGEHREGTEIRVAHVDPAEYIEVSLGEPVTKETTVRHPLTVRVRPGSPIVNRLGQTNEPGRILLETNHPEAKQIVILVKFATEDKDDTPK